jgi:hypothetical protein
MATNTPTVNAWIFLNEDEPPGTVYSDPTSCYQTLISNDVYQSIDLLYLCFVTTVPTSSTTVPSGDGSSYTIAMGAPEHNQPYMDNILKDAPANNPNIKIGVTLNWGDGALLANVFSNTSVTPQENAANFATNLVAYMRHYSLAAFDIDWESPICDQTTKQQFELLFTAIGEAFRQQNETYYLTLSPASIGCLDGDTVNQNFSFVNLQLYSGFTLPSDFTNAGVNAELFAYGAKFESDFQTAQQAYDDNEANYHYNIFTNWRLNSGNFQFEQQQQKALYALVFPGRQLSDRVANSADRDAAE